MFQLLFSRDDVLSVMVTTMLHKASLSPLPADITARWEQLSHRHLPPLPTPCGADPLPARGANARIRGGSEGCWKKCEGSAAGCRFNGIGRNRRSICAKRCCSVQRYLTTGCTGTQPSFPHYILMVFVY